MMQQSTFTAWTDQQLRQNKTIYLMLDTLATPNPLKQLFKVNLTNVNSFTCLYKDTEFAHLESVSPWLIPVDDSLYQAMQPLRNTPENNWGYLMSVDSQYSFTDLIEHWQNRIIIEEQPRSLYRFQDNRIIIRHLTQLKEQDIPLLLGPISEVIAWNEQQSQWHIFNNPQPKLYPHPTERPWLAIPEPKQLTKAIKQHNMMGWLLNNYPQTVLNSDINPFYEWVEEQLMQAEQWQWYDDQQQQHLIIQRLDKAQRIDSRWQPLRDETPQQHFTRCQHLFNKPLHYAELQIDSEKLSNTL